MNRRNLFGVLFGGIAAAFGLGCGPDKRRVTMLNGNGRWRELTKPEIITEAYKLKGDKLMSDKDVLTKMMKYSDEEATEILALKIQKLEELKLQIMIQNPQLIGIEIPGEA